MRTKLALATFLISLGGQAPLLAQEGSIAEQPKFVVRFEGGSQQENFANVVVELARSGALDHATYVDREGETPDKILQKTSSLAGSTVPFAMELYLCEINPHICRVVIKGRKVEWRNRKAPANTEDKVVTCGPTRSRSLDEWIAKAKAETLPTHVLCLPRMDVRRYATTVTIPFTSGKDNLAEIFRTRGACDLEAKACRELVDTFNSVPMDGKSVFSASYSGPLRIPAWGYTFTLPVTDRIAATNLADTLESVIKQQQADRKFAKLQKSNISYSLSTGKLGPQAIYAVNSNVDNATVRMLMSVPSTPPGPAVGQVFVGVLDDYVDNGHCVFNTANKLNPIVAFDPDTEPSNRRRGLTVPDRAACGSSRDYFSHLVDHGTHIAALIAGRHAPNVVVGLNPQANIWAYEIGDSTRLTRDPNPIARAAAEYGRGEPRVVNISRAQAAEQVSSVLETYIREYDGFVLFVAAAGGSEGNGRQIATQYDCRVIPACLSGLAETKDKVISVVAVDMNLQKLAGTPPANERVLGESTQPAIKTYTNWGPAFDVAAIGVAKSAIYGNYGGVADGTSIAAPYVTALASMLMGQYTGPRGMPKAVKKRILYTVDFKSELDQVVAWGLINFGRALRNSTDVTVIRAGHCQGPADCVFSRQVAAASTKPLILKSGFLEGRPVTVGTSILFSSVRRISRAAGDADTFYLVTETEFGLFKYSNVQFDGSPVLMFAGTSLPQAKGLSEIEDFTVGMTK